MYEAYRSDGKFEGSTLNLKTKKKIINKKNEGRVRFFMWDIKTRDFQDPREALILSLKREVGALQTENEHLRTALHLSNETQTNRSESKSTYRRRFYGSHRLRLSHLCLSVTSIRNTRISSRIIKLTILVRQIDLTNSMKFI